MLMQGEFTFLWYMYMLWRRTQSTAIWVWKKTTCTDFSCFTYT